MKYYTLNINALRKRYSTLVELLENLNDCSIDIEVLHSRNNMPIIKYNNRLLHSRYNPVNEAKIWVEANAEIIDNKKNGLIVVGFGLGYHIEEIIKKNEEKEILIIEPSVEIFKKACENRDLTNIIENKNIILSVGENYETVEKRMYIFGKEGLIQTLDLICLTSYENLFDDFYMKVAKTLKDVIGSKIININTIIYFAKTWPTNFFRNLKYMLASVETKKIFDKFKNKPGILVSAGPSLNKNVHLLKEIKGKAFILSVDTALKVLLKEGIIPDAVIAVDGSELNYKHFQDLNYDGIPLIYISEVNNKILKNHTGSKIIAKTSNMIMEWFEKTLDLDIGGVRIPGPTVANIAFQLLDRYGCNPIIMIGQDLAYTNNISHAEGTALKKDNMDKKISDKNKIIVEDIYGKEVITDRGLYSALKSLESIIKTYNGIAIDATEGGAKIKGTEIMTLMEAKEKHCKENIGVQEILEEVLNKEVEVEKAKKLVSNMKDIVRGLSKIKKLGDKGIKKSQQLIKLYEKKHINDKSINEILDSLDKIDEKIKKEAEIFTFINMIIQPVMLQVMKGEYSIEPENETEIEKGIRIGKRSEILYEGIKEVSKYMVDLINETIEEIQNMFLN